MQRISVGWLCLRFQNLVPGVLEGFEISIHDSSLTEIEDVVHGFRLCVGPVPLRKHSEKHKTKDGSTMT